MLVYQRVSTIFARTQLSISRSFRLSLFSCFIAIGSARCAQMDLSNLESYIVSESSTLLVKFFLNLYIDG